MVLILLFYLETNIKFSYNSRINNLVDGHYCLAYYYFPASLNSVFY